ncbi:MAG: PaaI family thioesterase, partial [Pseudomonadota bacterium]|nr:PaaI family thioesterase [Pseudomonadota bacterium]
MRRSAAGGWIPRLGSIRRWRRSLWAGSSPLTVEFKINLLAPALGERFVASAKVVRAGRTLTIVEADVTAETKGVSTPIARMLATLICLENTPDQPAQPAG